MMSNWVQQFRSHIWARVTGSNSSGKAFRAVVSLAGAVAALLAFTATPRMQGALFLNLGHIQLAKSLEKPSGAAYLANSQRFFEYAERWLKKSDVLAIAQARVYILRRGQGFTEGTTFRGLDTSVYRKDMLLRWGIAISKANTTATATAVRQMEAVVEVFSYSPSALLTLGGLYGASGQAGKALDTFALAKQYDPAFDARADMVSGIFLLQANQHAEARPYLELAAIEDARKQSLSSEERSQLKTALGLVYLTLGEKVLAERAFVDALSLVPDGFLGWSTCWSHIWLGQMAQGSGDFETAKYHYELAVTLAPTEEAREEALKRLCNLTHCQN